MTFKINLESLHQMSVIALNAADVISEAVSTSSQIVDHSDWTCKERIAIIDEIQQMKKELNKTDESMRDFSNRLLLLANRFTEITDGWKSAMGAVDRAIASQVSITSSASAVNNTYVNSLWTSDTSVNGSGALSAYEAHAASDPIAVCDFNRVDWLNNENNI